MVECKLNHLLDMLRLCIENMHSKLGWIKHNSQRIIQHTERRKAYEEK